jgi:hypothetical protein
MLKKTDKVQIKVRDKKTINAVLKKNDERKMISANQSEKMCSSDCSHE